MVTARRVILAVPPVVVALSYLVWTHFAAQVAVGNLPPFDLRLYGYEEAKVYLAGLSDTARAVYLGPLHWADLALMISLTLTLLLPVWRKGWAWCLPAIGYLVFDVLENRAVAALLTRGLHEVGEVAALSLFTGIKFGALALAAVLAVWRFWAIWRARA
ncbi:MAG: hypothetical protein RLZZ437_2649 [Pseudomonadota bacterium]|jgi:hypothetical protein